MANLDQIQQLLNNNEDYRKRFLQDPVAALAQQGLQLSFEMQQQVRNLVKQAQTSVPSVPGAAVGGFNSPIEYKPSPIQYKGSPIQYKPSPVQAARQIPITLTLKV